MLQGKLPFILNKIISPFPRGSCKTGLSSSLSKVWSQYLDYCPDCRCLSPFSKLVFSPKTTRNLKTYHNMLRFPAINHSINRHQYKPLWLKSPPRKVRMYAGAGAEIIGSEQSHWKAPLGSLARKGTLVTAPGAPRTPWAPAAPSSAGGSCLQGLPGSPRGIGAGVQGAGPGDRCAGRARPVGLLQGVLWCPPGRWGAGKVEL